MNQSHPSNDSTTVDPPSTAIPNVDAAPIRQRDGPGVEGFVAAAYEAHHDEVFAFLARSTLDRGAAEDLLRETYLRLTKEVRYGRPPVQVRGWLYRVASNLVVEPRRRRTWTGRLPGQNGRDERERAIAPAVAPGVGGEPNTGMERVLEGLSPDARVALLLSGEGFTGEEIAAAIGRSAAATRTLLCLARTRVRVRRGLFAVEAR